MKTDNNIVVKMPIRNSRLEPKLWLTPRCRYCTVYPRDLSRDLDVTIYTIIKSGIAPLESV